MEATAKSSATLAALDLGSNSFRMLIGSWNGDRFLTQVNKLATVGLSRGLAEHGKLQPEAIAAGLAVLRIYREIIGAQRVTKIRICGTQALRQAINCDDFIGPAQEIIGATIEIISATDEASLSLAGASQGQTDHEILLADVGGGSSELIHSVPDALPRILSLALGAVVLTEALAADDNKGLALLTVNRVRLADFFSPIPALTSLTGVGGTATTLAMLDLGLDKYDGSRVQGHVISTQRLNDIYADVAALSDAERHRLPGLKEGRADIILAGIMVYQAIMTELKIERLQISEAGILEGIILSLTAGHAMYQAIN